MRNSQVSKRVIDNCKQGSTLFQGIKAFQSWLTWSSSPYVLDGKTNSTMNADVNDPNLVIYCETNKNEEAQNERDCTLQTKETKNYCPVGTPFSGGWGWGEVSFYSFALVASPQSREGNRAPARHFGTWGGGVPLFALVALSLMRGVVPQQGVEGQDALHQQVEVQVTTPSLILGGSIQNSKHSNSNFHKTSDQERPLVPVKEESRGEKAQDG